MAENSAIEWCDHTFNPWEGCQKVGPGCDHCYAEARDVRFTGGTHWGPNAPRRLTSKANWAKPIKWNREAAASRTRPRVFCASLADVFDNAVDPAWREDLFCLIDSTPHLDWLLLTKRPGNIAKMLPSDWGTGWPNVWLGCTVVNQTEADRDIPKLLEIPAAVRFLSIEPMLGPIDLTRIHAPENWGPNPDGWTFDATQTGECYTLYGEGPSLSGDGPHRDTAIDWVIVGGESGPHARPMHPDWARSLRDQCAASGVPFLFKQWGEYAPVEVSEDSEGELGPAYPIAGCSDPAAHKYNQPCLFWQDSHDDSAPVQWPQLDGGFGSNHWIGARRIGKKAAGRLLDGVEHNGFPEVQHG